MNFWGGAKLIFMATVPVLISFKDDSIMAEIGQLDPAVIGAFGVIVTAIITNIATTVNLSGRLKEEKDKREKLEVELAEERQHRYECMKQVAKLEGVVSALKVTLRTKGLL